ncbi:MAG: cation transporter [Alphaproteobacteria bacterium]|nr:cation transporter [Alphaproteobacteria bacterium]
MTSIEIQGMTCQNCVRKITAAFQEAGIAGKVTLDPPAVTFEGNAPDRAALSAALAKAGDHYHLKEGAGSSLEPAAEPHKSWLEIYYPLLLIFGFISVVSFKGADTWHDWMLHFMAGFFLVFSFFKFLSLTGFKDAYSTYDLLAKKWNGYGYLYPFLELGLGLAFLFGIYLQQALWFSIVLMGFSSLGVIKALSEKKKIRCACLGTVLNLPMSTLTLVEDLGMVAMSIAMLAF